MPLLLKREFLRGSCLKNQRRFSLAPEMRSSSQTNRASGNICEHTGQWLFPLSMCGSTTQSRAKTAHSLVPLARSPQRCLATNTTRVDCGFFHPQGRTNCVQKMQDLAK